MKGTGSSKRDNADEYDEETGTAIAVQRALMNLSRKLGRQAAGKVKHADDNRRARAVAAEKKIVEAAFARPEAAAGRADDFPANDALLLRIENLERWVVGSGHAGRHAKPE